MRNWTKKRGISSLVAAAYVLTITTAGLFHNHAARPGDGDCCHSAAIAHEESSHGDHGEPCGGSSRHDEGPRPCSPNDGQCPVCQFLAQKPAPMAAAAPASMGILVQSVAASAPARVVAGIFSAWHSRAPPAIA